jgi:hypothetical protein
VTQWLTLKRITGVERSEHARNCVLTKPAAAAEGLWAFHRTRRIARGVAVSARRVAEPELRSGKWQLLECTPAWDGNWSFDNYIAFAWTGKDSERLIVAVNYSPTQSQCHVRWPFADAGNAHYRLSDLLSNASYDWNGKDLTARGLYLDEPAWKASVFSISR